MSWSGSPAYVLPKRALPPSMKPTWSCELPSRPKYARSRSLTIGKMLRLTDTRGTRAWPASAQALRKRLQSEGLQAAVEGVALSLQVLHLRHSRPAEDQLESGVIAVLLHDRLDRRQRSRGDRKSIV